MDSVLDIQEVNGSKTLKNSATIYAMVKDISKFLKLSESIAPEEITKIRNAVYFLEDLVHSNKSMNEKIKAKTICQTHSINQILNRQIEITELEEDLRNCKTSLKISEDSSIPMDLRLRHMPTPTQGGFLSVSYFISKENEKGTMEKKFLVKSSKLEPKAEEMMHCGGFSQGAGVIREMLAYYAQEQLQLQCGVPTTFVTELEHTMFGEQDTIRGELKQLGKLTGLSISRNHLAHLLHCNESIEDTFQRLKDLQMEELEEYMQDLDEETKLQTQLVPYILDTAARNG